MTVTSHFELTKWYIDCVDADGRAAIAYWASIALRGLTFTWHSVATYEPGASPSERNSVRTTPAPDDQAGCIAWNAPAIGCVVRCEPTVRPAHIRLLDDQTGTVEWHCDAPAARCSIEVRGHPEFLGTGYAEHLAMTVPPWRLPIDELRWGRWISTDAGRSVVWIDWRGDSPATWVVVDGTIVPGSAVRDDSVTTPGGSLVLGEGRTLHQRSVDNIARRIPGLARLLPKSVLALAEHKRCSMATWLARDAAPVTGRAIHEVVLFR